MTEISKKFVLSLFGAIIVTLSYYFYEKNKNTPEKKVVPYHLSLVFFVSAVIPYLILKSSDNFSLTPVKSNCGLLKKVRLSKPPF